MNVTFTKENIIFGGLALCALVSSIFALKASSDLKKIERRLDKTIDEIKDDGIDISEDLVSDIVERAAKDEARYQVSKAMDKASKDIVKEYKSDIKTAVDNEFKLQKDSLTKTLRKKIDDVDINEIKREVKIEAKAYVAEKLKKDLDDIADKYTDQIESMSNIYSTIASKIETIGD
jgi:hypothetical protein